MADGPPPTAGDGVGGGWWFPAGSRQRLRLLRAILYAFVVLDVTVASRWVVMHKSTPSALYEPLFFARALALPVPTGRAVLVLAAAVVAAAAAATVAALVGRLAVPAGVAVAVLYVLWMFVGMSYGKVDHDRFALLLALAVLPTAGRVRPADRGDDERCGWALSMVQAGVMATYFLAAVAKLRYGGLAWLDSATLQRAVTRRGTALGDAAGAVPGLLHASQYLIMAFELSAPLMLARGRLGRAFIAGAVVLHVVTAATTGITFLPHVVCLLAFAPLERWADWFGPRARPGMGEAPQASLRGSPLPSR